MNMNAGRKLTWKIPRNALRVAVRLRTLFGGKRKKMAKKPETNFKDKVQRELKAMKRELGGLYFKKIQAVAHLGLPDIWMCVQGQFWVMELKKDDKAGPRVRQQYELDEVIAAGGKALCVSPENWPIVKDWIREQLTRGPSIASRRRPSALRRR